jgi:MFS family permease
MSGSAMPQPVKNRGWTVTTAATVALLMLGALYAWSVVSQAMSDDPLDRYADWSEADLIWPYSIALITFSVMTAVGGRIQDKRGPRLLIMVGAILAGGGMIVCGLSPSPWVWYLGFGILTGSGIGLAYSAGPPPAVKWFPASKSGLISGIVVAGFGGGAVWVAPTLRALIESYGIPTTMIIFGVAVIVVMIAAAQFVAAPPPGYVPAETGVAPAASLPQADYEPREMLRTWQFKVMAACFAFGGGAGLIFIGKMASIITSFGFAQWSAIAVSVMALGNGLGRVVYGKLSDSMGRRPVLVFALAFQAVLLLALAFFPVAGFTVDEYGQRDFEVNGSMGALALVLVLSALIGANYGANLAVFPALTKDTFGLKNFGANYGLVYQGWGFGGFFVSQVGAFLIASQKSAGDTNIYVWAYYWAIALLLVGVGLMLAFKAPGARPAPATA